MMIVPPQNQLLRFDESHRETTPIAVLCQEPFVLEEQCDLKFTQGYDDLDYLVFSVLSLPSQRCVALVRHKHSPSPGTEVCIDPNESAVAEILMETIRFLGLSLKDLSWIHPQHLIDLPGLNSLDEIAAHPRF